MLHEVLKGKGSYMVILRLSKRLYLGIFLGLLRAFEGLLEWVLGHIKAKAVVMLASIGA